MRLLEKSEYMKIGYAKDVADKNWRIIYKMLEIEKPSVDLKHLQLLVDLDPAIPSNIINDQSKVHRILLNLLGNAIKFTQHGTITIQTQLMQHQDQQVTIRLSITDTGIGIHPDQQHQVFDRFFRISPSYKGHYQGSGVGLHIAQSFAKLLKTEIKLHSQPEKGTTFYFDLTSKIGDSDALDSATTQAAHAKHHTTMNTHQPTVLLVEDNLVALKVLEALAAAANLKVVSQQDGLSALQAAKQNTFDLIITDIGLPDISGCEFAQQLRQWEAEQHLSATPIVALTAHTEETVQQDCRLAGISQVLFKPMTDKMLGALLKEYQL